MVITEAQTPEGPRRVRILHVLPDLDMAGGQQVLQRLLDGMDRERFEHFICYFLPNHEMRERFEATGARVTYVPHRGWWSWPRTLSGIVCFTRKNAIDVIHINRTPIDKIHGQLAALICRRPLVSTLHGPRWRPGPRWALFKHRIRETFEHVLDPCTTDRVVAVSDHVLESWRPYLEARRVPISRMIVVRNGVPPEKFDRNVHRDEIENLRAALGVENVYPILVTVGRLDANKGHRFLIPMMERVCEKQPEARLYIVGDGPLREDLRARIAERGMTEHIELLGRRHDVPVLLGLSDVFVFSSLGEGLPLAVLEAMAAATPVVAFHLPALTDLVENGIHGFHVHPQDVEALADRVLDVVRAPERAAAMGREANRRVIEEYDIHRSIRSIERIYEEAARS